MVKKRGLQVTTGSGNSVHKFTDDGNAVLGANSTSNEIAVSGSTHFGDKDTNSTDQGVIAAGMFRVPMYDSGSEGDISILNSLAASPSSYNGYIMYLSSSGVVSGGVASGGTVKVSNDAGQYFARGPAVYYCRNGNWFADMQVKVAVSSGGGGGAAYDGQTLNFDENFDSTSWGVYNYSADGFTSQRDEDFDSTSWGVYNYSADGFTSQRDDNFNLTDGWFGISEWWS